MDFDGIIIACLTDTPSTKENHIIMCSINQRKSFVSQKIDCNGVGFGKPKIQIISAEFQLQIVDEVDEMVALPFGQRLSAKITELTGITDETLRRAGKPQEQVCRDFMRLVAEENVLMVAYNAQFDMCFLGEFLRKHGHAQKFQSLYALDAMTVFKDRREYPHKLADAIEAYHLGDSVENSHHAIDDAKSLLAVLQAMDKERPDLIKYINLFGYNPKYGINGKPIPGITYKAQPYGNMYRLYEN